MAVLRLFAQHLDGADHAVFQHSHIVEQIEALEYHSHLGTVGTGVIPLCGDRLAVEQDLTGRRTLQQIDASQQGGFTAAGCANDTGNIAFPDSKVHIPKNGMVSECLLKMAYFNDGFRHFTYLLRWFPAAPDGHGSRHWSPPDGVGTWSCPHP